MQTKRQKEHTHTHAQAENRIPSYQMVIIVYALPHELQGGPNAAMQGERTSLDSAIELSTGHHKVSQSAEYINVGQRKAKPNGNLHFRRQQTHTHDIKPHTTHIPREAKSAFSPKIEKAPNIEQLDKNRPTKYRWYAGIAAPIPRKTEPRRERA